MSGFLEGTACIAYVGVTYVGIGHPQLAELDSTYSMQCGKNVVINGSERNSNPKTMFGRGWGVIAIYLHVVYHHFTLHLHYIYITFTLHLHYIYITFTLHLH